MTTFPHPEPAPDQPEHPRAATLPRELRPSTHTADSGPNATPAGPQPSEPSTLPDSAGGIEKIGGKQPGQAGHTGINSAPGGQS